MNEDINIAELLEKLADLTRFRKEWERKFGEYDAEMQQMAAQRDAARALLDRFAELFPEAEVSPDEAHALIQLWRDYYRQSGKHMILTDDGWVPGFERPTYEAIAKAEGLPVTELIFEELNPPEKSSDGNL